MYIYWFRERRNVPFRWGVGGSRGMMPNLHNQPFRWSPTCLGGGGKILVCPEPNEPVLALMQQFQARPRPLLSACEHPLLIDKCIMTLGLTLIRAALLSGPVFFKYVMGSHFKNCHKTMSEVEHLCNGHIRWLRAIDSSALWMVAVDPLDPSGKASEAKYKKPIPTHFFHIDRF